MQGKEAILNKIISDAENEEAAKIEEANTKAQKILDAAKTSADESVAASKTEQEKLGKEILNRADVVAALDAKKFLLDAKNEILKYAFAAALEKVRSLDKKTYGKLVLGMLEYAEDGDTVTVSAREKDILTEAKIKDFADKKKIKLSLGKILGDFDGGIVLSNGGVDKNLTLETEIEILRGELEEKIAKELFAEEK